MRHDHLEYLRFEHPVWTSSLWSLMVQAFILRSYGSVYRGRYLLVQHLYLGCPWLVTHASVSLTQPHTVGINGSILEV